MNMVYAVPLIVVAAGAALGVGLVRRGRWRWFWGIVVAVAALCVWAWAAAQGKDIRIESKVDDRAPRWVLGDAVRLPLPLVLR